MQIKMSVQLTTWMAIFALSLLICPVTVIGQEQPGKDDLGWLNGHWSGLHVAGGTLEMDLKVKGNEVTGDGVIRQGYDTQRSTVTGTMKDDQVRLNVYFARVDRTVPYSCHVTEEKALQCTSKNGAFETTFTKVR